MSIITGIISTVIVVAIFWFLHIYAVRRALFMVRLHVEPVPDQKTAGAKTIRADRTDQMVDAAKDSDKIAVGAKVESLSEKRKMREKPPVSSDERRWAIPN
jgi:hypothetical protein